MWLFALLAGFDVCIEDVELVYWIAGVAAILCGRTVGENDSTLVIVRAVMHFDRFESVGRCNLVGIVDQVTITGHEVVDDVAGVHYVVSVEIDVVALTLGTPALDGFELLVFCSVEIPVPVVETGLSTSNAVNERDAIPAVQTQRHLRVLLPARAD